MSKTSLSFLFLFAFALFAFAALMCVVAAGQAANYKVIHSFSGYPNDIEHPIGAVVFDSAGNMYGVGPGGGNDNDGAVFELSPDGRGGWTETILYDFCQNNDGLSCLDGKAPDYRLAIDAAGNLYGTTNEGGTGDEDDPVFPGGGVAFQLSPPLRKGGQWTETVLYNFCSNFVNNMCLDGGPGGASQMVFDTDGNLYGTTALGGLGHIPGQGVLPGGGGVVFELSLGAKGWTEKVLYNFCSQGQGSICPDGYEPNGVNLDGHGNLYGATACGGAIKPCTGGVLFEIYNSGNGWQHKSLAIIPRNYQPYSPSGPVTFDSTGNLYGGLALVYGGVYQRNAKTGKIKVLPFNAQDGFEPLGGVYVDAKTNILYGVNAGGNEGGHNGNPGNIFEIDPNGKETILHSFCDGSTGPNCMDGFTSWAPLVPDVRGNLYGTTEFGGAYNLGIVFELVP
jgi:uncharacterized repeat protein (TIGR03803 family)